VVFRCSSHFSVSEQCELTSLLGQIVATMTSDNIITTMALDTIVALYSTVAFVIPLVPC
jgi:hypothetical protein